MSGMEYLSVNLREGSDLRSVMSLPSWGHLMSFLSSEGVRSVLGFLRL